MRHKAAVAAYRRGVPVTRCVACYTTVSPVPLLARQPCQRYYTSAVIRPIRPSERVHQGGGQGADLLHASLVCGFLLGAEGVTQRLCLLLGLFHAL